MFRSEIQDKIRELVKTVEGKAQLEKLIADWLSEQNVSEFETKQIMNDLTSYKEFLELPN